MAARIASAMFAASAACVAASSAFQTTELWTAYVDPARCYRQPFLVKTSAALLAFVEGRPQILGECSGTYWPDVIDFPILLKSSTDDGATWGPEVNITHGNLDFLNAVYDAVTDQVVLLVQQGDLGTIQLTGSADGRTWSQPVNLGNLSFPAAGVASVIPGVGHGLQISGDYCLDFTCSGTAGWLVMPVVATTQGDVANDTSCGNCATAFLISSDHAATWQLGAVSAQTGSRESAIVQLDSAAFNTMGAVIYAGERNLGASTGFRLHSLSLDGGRSFKVEGADAGLPDVVTANWTGCVDGLARYDDPAAPAKGPTIVFTAPDSADQRANLTLWTGTQAAGTGVAWAAPLATLWAGPAAYSDALQINATHVGVVFEGGAQEFAGGILFTAVPMASA